MAWLQGGAFVLGLVALYYGAEWLVRGAARLARALGISALIVGLTVVAFGTSAPELIVSVLAAVRGQSDVSIGNVVGSNIANIALILGLSAVVSPMRAEMQLIRREMPVMIAAAVAMSAMALDGGFTRVDGLLLLAGLIAFLTMMVHAARREPESVHVEFEEFEEHESMAPHGESHLRNLALVAAGLVTLAGGAHLLVGSAVYFARAFGVSELVIGLTVVAVGTSLPELATSVVASMRREADIALGNLVGSNIFNVLAILGITALVQPIAVDRRMFEFEIPLMIGLSLLLPFFGWTRMRVERWEGAVLLAIYVGFTIRMIGG